MSKKKQPQEEPLLFELTSDVWKLTDNGMYEAKVKSIKWFCEARNYEVTDLVAYGLTPYAAHATLRQKIKAALTAK